MTYSKCKNDQVADRHWKVKKKEGKIQEIEGLRANPAQGRTGILNQYFCIEDGSQER